MMDYVAVLLPSLVVGLLFWFAMKSIFNADKAERQAEARAQAEADAQAAARDDSPEPPGKAEPPSKSDK
jgi:flagellar biosynthesis/type III secretory pathway M-ring protein FliF/YscJ